MNAVSVSSSTFAGSLSRSTPAVKIAAVVLGSLFVAAASQIVVPFFPVPMTMQTFAVLVIGLTFGWRFAALTLATYLVEGAAGLPVFNADGSILTLIAKPATAGYLVGFLASAVVTGALAQRFGKGLVGTLAAALVGDVVIFACGLAFLSVLFGTEKAIAVGLLPFLPGEALKIALAVAVARGACRFNRA